MKLLKNFLNHFYKKYEDNLQNKMKGSTLNMMVLTSYIMILIK